MKPIALDAMGGDHGPRAAVLGALQATERGVDVVLVGDPTALQPCLPRWSRVPIYPAADSFGMAEPPAGIRSRPESSLRVGLRLVAEGRCGALVSCGNTGAVLVGAVLDLGLIPGVDRPPLATVLPRADGGRLVLLDAGANVDCKPEQLVTFARLGAAYAECLGVRRPRVGLLSNGEEETKGNAQGRATLPLLRGLGLAVVGNVEPSAAMEGACDVLVCDGFMGNILLKAAEGAVSTMGGILREEIQRYPSARFGAVLLRGALRRFRRRVAWEALGGAVLLGAGGLVLVGHGRSGPQAVASALEQAAGAVRAGLDRQVRKAFSGA